MHYNSEKSKCFFLFSTVKKTFGPVKQKMPTLFRKVRRGLPTICSEPNLDSALPWSTGGGPPEPLAGVFRKLDLGDRPYRGIRVIFGHAKPYL